MSTSLISDLAESSPPTIRPLLEAVVDALSSSPRVRRVALTGGRLADLHRAGEIELVVVVDDDCLDIFALVLDDLMMHGVGTLLPGWRENAEGAATSVDSLYLAPHAGRLHRLRVRLVGGGPAETVDSQEPSCPLYVADQVAAGVDSAPGLTAEAPADRPSTAAGLLCELLVRLHTLRDELGVSGYLRGYGRVVEVREALAELVAAVLGLPESRRRWADLDGELAVTPLGRACRTALHDLVAAPVPGTPTDVAAMVRTCLDLVAVADPALAAEWGGTLDSYRHYMDAA
ncbi:hypothetical protein ABZ805_22150 [Saccharopolyspora sp. NPDC047091]|uniref:hypothetical protein n=1 Tax=Saccharopolyspora sp. NPDC047091 TaxID=3155924 RepID=UPI0033FDB17A